MLPNGRDFFRQGKVICSILLELTARCGRDISRLLNCFFHRLGRVPSFTIGDKLVRILRRLCRRRLLPLTVPTIIERLRQGRLRS